MLLSLSCTVELKRLYCPCFFVPACNVGGSLLANKDSFKYLGMVLGPISLPNLLNIYLVCSWLDVTEVGNLRESTI